MIYARNYVNGCKKEKRIICHQRCFDYLWQESKTEFPKTNFIVGNIKNRQQKSWTTYNIARNDISCNMKHTKHILWSHWLSKTWIIIGDLTSHLQKKMGLKY